MDPSPAPDLAHISGVFPKPLLEQAGENYPFLEGRQQQWNTWGDPGSPPLVTRGIAVAPMMPSEIPVITMSVIAALLSFLI
jgi:hypothetical protein